MRHDTTRARVSFWVMVIVAVGGGLAAAQSTSRSPVADAASRGETNRVRQQLRDGGDVSTAQGDGMTALHWAASRGDAELASVLLYAGASVQSLTRLGGYTPLHLASQFGHTSVIEVLLDTGANVSSTTTTGATPLMHAAASGNVHAVRALLGHNADPDARESAHGQTALMFAAARNRAAAVALLLSHGASTGLTSTMVDVSELTAPEASLQAAIRQARNERSAATAVARAEPGDTEPDHEQDVDTVADHEGQRVTQPSDGSREAPEESAASEGPEGESDDEPEVAGVTRPYSYNELIGKQGGLTALHFAARQGALATVETLVISGTDVNQVSPADHTSPLLIAVINGHFDVASLLLEHGADPRLANDAGLTPLYGVLNIQWAPRSFYPQPQAQLQQRTDYLELMTALIAHGADPNVRLTKRIWFTEYNFGLLRMNDIGATPFWRAAHASDVAAMKLLVARGADPTTPTTKPASRRRPRQGGTSSADDTKDHSGLSEVPVGGPGIPPLLAAAGTGYGQGFVGNAHRFAPTGMLTAVRYLIDELGAEVKAVDHNGNTAVHNAAARGDTAMIEYLVSRGADVTRVNRGGQTTVDMANGPVQRVQPFPDTIALLESLGATNNHKCVSC